MAIDHILIIGFGGPTSPQDVRPFLEGITRGLHVPSARLDEVAHHYERVGGASPYNAHVSEFVDELRARWATVGITQPVFLGMRHWHPFLADVAQVIHRQGLRRGVAVILAPHRCEASFERYVKAVDEALIQANARELYYTYVPSWHLHPCFIQAQAELAAETLTSVEPIARAATALLFSAHSIPQAMAGAEPYAQDVEASSRAVTQRLGWPRWRVAYQSRSGPPTQPWLQPGLEEALQALASEGARQVVVVPIGFVCDHVEVLFDLDCEARGLAVKTGLGFSRVPTVMAHPAFIELFAELIQASLAEG